MKRVLLALLAGSLILIAVSIAGVANPPQAATVMLSIRELAGLSRLDERAGIARYGAGPLPSPPYTIEAQMLPAGPAPVWGLWLGAAAAPVYILLDNESYFSIGLNDWRPFLHLRSGLNRVYLHVDRSGNATLRLNGEIAWQGQLIGSAPAEWGVALGAETYPTDFHLVLRAD
ncbi:MAG: hypothetical protein DIU68_013425 [Chloroflexota bacterium]